VWRKVPEVRRVTRRAASPVQIVDKAAEAMETRGGTSDMEEKIGKI